MRESTAEEDVERTEVPAPPASIDLLWLVWNEPPDMLARAVRGMLDNLDSAWSGTAIVVWNGGRRATLRAMMGLVRSAWPRAMVKALTLPRNVGFGRAVNLGMEQGSARYVAIFNPDGVASPGCVPRLVAALDGDAKLFAASANLDPRCRDRPSGPQVVECVGYLPGGACVVRRRAFSSVGGYDPMYFLYCEDNDLAKRAVDSGWTLAMVCDATFVHSPRLDQRGATALRQFHKQRSWCQYLLVHRPSMWTAVWESALQSWRVSARHLRRGWIAGAAARMAGGLSAPLSLGVARRRRRRRWDDVQLRAWLIARRRWTLGAEVARRSMGDRASRPCTAIDGEPVTGDRGEARATWSADVAS